MHARTFKLSAIGAAVGLVLAAVATVAPASAAPASTTTTITSSCGAFKGATVTGPSATFNGVALRTGDVITVAVSPARSEDKILLTTVAGSFNFNFLDAPAPSGLSWRAPADGVYSLQWSFASTGTPLSSATWSFQATCSTTSFAPAPAPSPSEPTKPGKGKRGRG